MLIVLLCRNRRVYVELALFQVGNELRLRAVVQRTYEVRPAYGFQFCVGQICCKFADFIHKLQSGYEPVKERIQCEFAKILDSENTEKYYRNLIERYSRDLYELLIGQRYAEERYERFLADISGYFSLAVYYDDSIDSKSAKDAKSVGTALTNNDFCRQMPH